MPSDEEPGTSNIVPEYETQFVPRSDDDEVLWEVQEITAEHGKKYKVKWAGTDPATGKPWAQSWVAKHDCTDDLVVEWKAKKKKLGGRRTGTASRTSGPSTRAGSSTSGKVSHPATSEATTSRSDSAQVHRPSPLKGSNTKRKRVVESPATTSSGIGKADEEGDLSRPRKKLKPSPLERLLPPLSSDEDEMIPPMSNFPEKVIPEDKGPLKGVITLPDDSDNDDRPPPKAKAEPARRSDARSEGGSNARVSDSREESGLRDTRRKTEVLIPSKDRVTDDTPMTSQDKKPLHKSEKKPSSPTTSLSGRNDDVFEREVPPNPPVKVGPPRGVKRQRGPRESGPPSKPGSSRTKSREDDLDAEHKSTRGRPDNGVSTFGRPFLLRQDVVDNPTSDQPPSHLSIPPVPPCIRPHSPELSPGARARLELFDRQMARLEHIPDDTHFNYDDNYDMHDTSRSPRPQSPPPSKSTPKHSKQNTTNGLIVPETESSRTSSGQPQLLVSPPCSPRSPPVPEPPRQPVDLPTIAIIAPPALSSSVSPQGHLPSPQKPPPINRPPKRLTLKPVPQISPKTFRSTIRTYAHFTGSEVPPSSIESFTSPMHVDKGKQKEVELDELQDSPSEKERDDKRKKRIAQRKMTDSLLKKRGKELFDRVQLVREAEQRKGKKARRLKTVGELVHRTVPLPRKGSSLPFISGVEKTTERGEEVIDLTGGANSATLDAMEHGKAQPLSEEERGRLRIELREEEEESTQEALGIYPPPPAEGFSRTGARDAQMSTAGSLKDPSSGEQLEDAGRVELPSIDLQLASVIVQPSQEPQRGDTDVDPSQPNQLTSSLPRPVPENLTDSPKRRLGEALSLLNVKSEEIQRLERELADERKNVQTLKSELAETQQSPEPAEPVRTAWEAERVQWATDRSKWENDLAMWEAQRKEWSDEKASLSGRVEELLVATARAEEVRVKLSELEAERVTWTKEREALQSKMAQRSEELVSLTKIRSENDEDRLKWEADKVSWAGEKVTWEAERAALQEKQETSLRSINELTASMESLTSAKLSAEKDSEFFREQYAQASGFVSSIREENAELEEKAKIAEGQAREGVASIKAFYGGRIKALQADVSRWKGTAELLHEKDRRINDELRLRAAQAPELGDLCGRLMAERKTLEGEIQKLRRAQQRSCTQQNTLYRKIMALKKERGSLRTTLSKFVPAADNDTQEALRAAAAPPAVEHFENLDLNDMGILSDPTPLTSDNVAEEPALFPCMWRPQWRDQCQLIFDAKEDLERHMQEHFRDLLGE